jgi:hypothetical protein
MRRSKLPTTASSECRRSDPEFCSVSEYRQQHRFEGVANGGPETGVTITTSARHLTAGLPTPGLRPSLGLPPHTRLAMSLANAGCNSSMTMAGSLIAVGRSVPCGLAGCQSTYSDVTGNAPTRRWRERSFLETPYIASILISFGTGWERRLAEGVGFEPTRDLATPGGFQDRCLKPLGHPSISTRSDT